MSSGRRGAFWGLQQLLLWGVAQEGPGLRSPLPPLPTMCTDWRSLSAWPGPAARWGGHRCRDVRVSGLEGTVIMEPPLCLVPLHSVFCRGWETGYRRAVYTVYTGGWLLRGQQPSPNKVVSI